MFLSGILVCYCEECGFRLVKLVGVVDVVIGFKFVFCRLVELIEVCLFLMFVI